MIRLPALAVVSFLAGCATDFGLQEINEPEPYRADTAEPPAEEEPVVDEEPVDTGDTGEPYEPADDEDEPMYEEDPPEDDCTETSDLIYVIERDSNELYLFDPEALQFSRLGRIACGNNNTPGSMAVSRSGQAYVRFSDDRLYQVDLTDLACTPTGFTAPSNFGSYGMGYATLDGETWKDELFIADKDRVGQLDTSTWTLNQLGDMASQSELTGNGSGELWAFLPLESPPALARLDKNTGDELERIRLSGFPNLSDIDTFAFANWDGTFWLFVRSYGMGSSTNVYEVGEDGQVRERLEDVGFDVVGAGVSTCAPS